MAFQYSFCENYGDKENTPSSSPSAKPAATFSKVPSYKKRKSRLPLEDITNLYYPRSLQKTPSVLDAPSLFLLVFLVYEMKNRSEKAGTAKSRNSNAAAATLRKHFR